MVFTSPPEQVQARKPGPVDESTLAYQLQQPFSMVLDAFVASTLDLDDDGRDWVPQSKDLAFKPLILNVTHEYYINILRVRASGVLSRHRHSWPVHALTLPGRWQYPEHHWIASAGDYAFEPLGETHVLVVPDDVSEITTLLYVSLSYTYVDSYCVAPGYEDMFTKVANAICHYQAIGLGADHMKQFVR